MRYIQTILSTLVLFCLFNATPAVAADWSGFYVGANYGTETVEANWTTTQTRDPDGDVIPMPTSDTEAAFESKESAIELRGGYNWNLGSWVVGVEAITGSIEHSESLDDRIPGLGDTSSDPTSFVNVRAESDEINLRLRGGYLVIPDLLLFVMAGSAKLDVEVTSTCPADTNVCDPSEGTQSFRNSKSLSETVIGFGAEYALNSFVLRVEYFDADFGNFSFTAIPESSTTFGADASIDVTTEVLHLGVSYGF